MPHTSTSRRGFLKAGGALALATSVRPAVAAPDPSRIALVVGNDAYTGDLKRLQNAVNDAAAVRDLLTQADFAVTYQQDARQAAFRDAVAAFGAAAARPQVKQAFFYYAGHGAQLNWRNYLLPVDAKVTTDVEIASQGVDLGALLADLSKARGKVFVLILDACRDDPFGQALQLPQKGLSQFDAPPNTLIGFSTAPGRTATDMGAGNGLYTQNLVRELSVKSTRLDDGLKRVRLAVRVASKGAQVPWESTSLESDVFLFPTAASKMSEADIEAQFQRELAEWARIKSWKRADDWLGYLQTYPGGRFTEIAQTRLNAFLAEQEASAAPVTVAVAAAPLTVAVLAPSVVAVAAPPIVTTSPRAPQLVIAQGSPVPVLIRPSPNPASAGTYVADRRFSVGDEMLYAEYDAYGKRLPDRLFQVTRVDEETDVVEFNNGVFLWDTLGNTVKSEKGFFQPRIQHVPADFQVGRTWTTRFHNADGNSDSHYDYRITAREKVRVIAGEFDAFRIEGSGYNTRSGALLAMRQWSAPGFNFMIKYEFTVKDRNSVFRGGEAREMISAKQMRWSQA